MTGLLPTILAIDPSGRGTGVALGLPGQTPKLSTHCFNTDETDTSVDIFGRAAWWFSRQLVHHPPDVLAIEHPLVVHNPMIVCGLYAIFTGMAQAQQIRVLSVTIAEWRKYFLGSSRLDGKTAKANAVRLCRALKWDAPDHNAAEAAGIWLYACAQIAPTVAHRPEPLFTGNPQAMRRA